MSDTRRNRVVTVTGAALIAALAVFPASIGFAAERAVTPTLPYELDALAPPSPGEASIATETTLPAIGVSLDPESQRCIAKVIHHEARNQPRAGMIAVAETLINRVKAGGRFGKSVCAVATQRGQYFDIHAYHPSETSADWQTAMVVAQEALSGNSQPVVPGAMYFRAAYRPASNFFRTRQRVAAVGDQVFYR